MLEVRKQAKTEGTDEEKIPCSFGRFQLRSMELVCTIAWAFLVMPK